MKISKTTILRTLALFLALLNEILVMCGKSPVKFTNEETAQAASFIFLALSAVSAWWKNNSFTQNALSADAFLNSLKANAKENKNGK